MVNPVDKLGAAIAALRAQRLAEQRRRQRPGAAKAAAPQVPQTAAERTAALKHAVALAVSAIEPDAADRRQRARRVFVEQVLQFEFGREIALDRQFATMVRRVAADLCSDEIHAAQLDAQLEGLVRQLPGNSSA